MNTSLKNKQPLLVGLTGGIGSGKTTIAKIFLAMGVPVFNSDNEAKNILDEDDLVKKQLTNLFGKLYEDGTLNRNKLADIVFNDKEALEKVNQIVHPAVAKKFKEWVEANKLKPILIKEAAILIESGAYKELDKIILVKASEQTRIERVMKRNNISEKEVKRRMANQLKDEDKKAYCDYFINNDEELIIPQVIEVYKKLTN